MRKESEANFNRLTILQRGMASKINCTQRSGTKCIVNSQAKNSLRSDFSLAVFPAACYITN